MLDDRHTEETTAIGKSNLRLRIPKNGYGKFCATRYVVMINSRGLQQLSVLSGSAAGHFQIHRCVCVVIIRPVHSR